MVIAPAKAPVRNTNTNVVSTRGFCQVARSAASMGLFVEAGQIHQHCIALPLLLKAVLDNTGLRCRNTSTIGGDDRRDRRYALLAGFGCDQVCPQKNN